MFDKILAPTLGALAVVALISPASAQYPQQQPQYAPPQTSQACVRLESQLASLDSQNGPNPQQRQLEADYNQQRQQMDRLVARSRGMGCGRNFLFGPRPPQECRGLEDQIDRMRNQVARLESQLNRGRGDRGLHEARRRDIIAALAQNQCGPQYQAAAQQERQPARPGLFGLLFGDRSAPQQPLPPQDYVEVPQTSTFRTVCVRTCDGFFFPVSFSTVPSRFGQDENMCRRTCPGTEAMMFSYPNPGGTLEQATSITGQPYPSLPNAFRYQREFVKDCSCKPAGMSWEQALAGAEDGTLQSGDIIVDENRSRAMSGQNGINAATPDEAARAAQDNAVIGEGVVEGAANTEVPDGYYTEQTPRTAEPYYMPPAQYPQQPQYAPPQQYAPPPAQQPQRRQPRDDRYVHPTFR